MKKRKEALYNTIASMHTMHILQENIQIKRYTLKTVMAWEKRSRTREEYGDKRTKVMNNIKEEPCIDQ